MAQIGSAARVLEDRARASARSLMHRGAPWRLPVRLELLFPWLGIGRRKSADTALHGALVETADGRFDILVRADLPKARHRFTVAHELGHRVLDQLGIHSAGTDAKTDLRVERLCDVVASELLMPEAAMRALASRLSGDPLRIVPVAAREFDVSLAAALYRTAEFVGSRGVVQVWEYASAWRLVTTRSIKCKRELATFEPDGWTSGVADEAARREAWSHEGWLVCGRTNSVLKAQSRSCRVFGRRNPTLLVHHALDRAIGEQPAGELTTLLARQHRQAAATAARQDCATCEGTGWMYGPSGSAVTICSCRYRT